MNEASSAKLAIIIVNYNTEKELKDCLFSVYDNNLNMPFEIFVVDNNSRDKSVDMIKNNFPEVKLIENDRNLGFAKANNKAIKISLAPYILLLNPDIVLKKDSLSKMVSFMEENPKIGILGCKLVNQKNELLPSCEKFPGIMGEFLQNIYLDKIIRSHYLMKNITLSKWKHDERKSVDWITGACFMMRKTMLEDIGLMDERYFLYYEDVDLCYRAKKHGWEVYFMPEAEVIHYQGRSSRANLDKTIAISYWSKFFFYKKYYSLGTYNFLKFINYIGLILRIITRTLFLPLNLIRYKEYLIYLKAYFNSIFINLEKEENDLKPMSDDGSVYKFALIAVVFLAIGAYSYYLSSVFPGLNALFKYILPMALLFIFASVFKNEILSTLQKTFLYLIFIAITLYGTLSHQFFKLFNKNKVYDRILITQPGHIGDLILTIPFLRSLKEEFPQKKITLVVGKWNESLLKMAPYIDNHLFYNNPFLNKNPHEESMLDIIKNIYRIVKQVRQDSYDMVFDLRGHINSLWLVYAARANEIFGFDYNGHGMFLDKKVKFNMEQYEAERICSLLSLINAQTSVKEFQFSIKPDIINKVLKNISGLGIKPDDPIIGVFPGAPLFFRRWEEDGFVELIKHIVENYKIPVFLFGGKEEIKLNDYLKKFVGSDLVYNFAAKTTLEELAVFIKRCGVFISNDTGPMHMSTVQDVSTIALFGPGSSKRWFTSKKNNHFLLKKEINCSPCKQIYHSFIPEKCIHPQISCIEKIEAGEAKKVFDLAFNAHIKSKERIKV